MDFTYELAKAFNVLPFEIFKQDKDEVIMLVNYLIEKSEDDPVKSASSEKHVNNKQQRIRVNDKTATGGWF